MSLRDLGHLQDKLLIFGGPYSNLQATQAIREVAETLEIPADHCICTGDIVAYCAQPNETVALLKDWGVHCLLGNCEESLAENKNDCGCGFAEGTACDVLSAQWFEYSKRQLHQSHKEWFAALPRTIRFNYAGYKIEVVHGSVSSINRFIFASTAEQVFAEEFALSTADIILAGHSGIPFTKKVGRRYWHNAGVIGMPANDATPNTWYSVISINENAMLQIQQCALQYNYQQAYAAMHQANLTNSYAQALQSGIWPSNQILPPSEQAQQGIALQANTVTLKQSPRNSHPEKYNIVR